MSEQVKIVVFVPKSHTDIVRQVREILGLVKSDCTAIVVILLMELVGINR